MPVLATTAAAAAGVELIVVNCRRKRHKQHHQQLTNGSTILFTFTFPVNLDLFSLSTVSFTFHVCNFVKLYIDSVFSVGIRSVFLRYYQYYRWKTRSVHFGVKKGAVSPFFLKRGAMAPFLRRPTPLLDKGGWKGGNYTKKGGTIPTEIPKIQQIWYWVNTHTKKTAGNTVVYNSTILAIRLYVLSMYMHTYYRNRNFEFYMCAYRVVTFYVYMRIRTKKSKKTYFRVKRETHPKDMRTLTFAIWHT